MNEQKWKEKYLGSLEQFEVKEKQWQVTSNLLRQGISRVALAAQGTDAQLDQDLAILRKHITKRTIDPQHLEEIIDSLSVSVTRLDKARSSKTSISSPQELITHWLDSLSLPRALKKPLKQLRHSIKQTSGLTEMATPMHELADLLNKHHLQRKDEARSKNSKAGIFQHLFGGARSNNSFSATDKPHSLRDFSIQLLDLLSFPHDLNTQAEELKNKLAASTSEDEIGHALADIAHLISAMRQNMENETHELQDFLRQLTENLHEIDQNIASAHSHHLAGIDSGRKLDEAVHHQVTQIETTIENVDDPAQLRSQIQERLSAIREHLDQFRDSEEENQKLVEAKLEQLNSRIHNMESEGDLLRQRLKEKHELAMHDPLTGLSNRLAYDERIIQEYTRWKRYGKPLVLTIIDIDLFKGINDNYGHKAGDKALKLIAEQLQENLRGTDFLARYGGEEFTILMPETSLDSALIAANKLREAVAAAKFHYQSVHVSISVSAGLAELSGDDTPESLFKRADKALYRAKEAGRNRCETESS